MRFSCWQSQLSPEPWRAECDRTWFWFPRKLGRGAKDLLSNVTMKIACIWDPNFTVWFSSMILVGSQRDGWGGWSGCCCYHWMRPSSVCVKPHLPSSGCRLGPLMGFSTRLVAQATHLQSPPLLFLLYFSLLTSLQAPLSPSLKPLLSTLLIFSLNLLWMLLHPSQWKFHLLNCADLKHRSILSFSPTPYPVHRQILITQQLQNCAESDYSSAPPPPLPASRHHFSSQIFPFSIFQADLLVTVLIFLQSKLFWSWSYWHLCTDNSLLRTVLDIVGCLAASLNSTRWKQVPPHVTTTCDAENPTVASLIPQRKAPQSGLPSLISFSAPFPLASSSAILACWAWSYLSASVFAVFFPGKHHPQIYTWFAPSPL